MKSVCSRWIISILLLILLPFCVQAKVYMVSIGISDYPGESDDLSFSVKDARSLIDVYSMNSDFHYSFLQDSGATKSKILSAIDDVSKVAKDDDILVLFYSGHGCPDGFYVYDGPLKYEEIKLKISRCRCKTKIIFADACKSGKFRTANSSASTSLSSVPFGNHQNREKNVMLFLSSRNDEFSIESSNMSGSYFSKFLSKGLSGAADKNGDMKVVAKELFMYVYANVVKVSGGEQHPVMWGSFPDDMIVTKYK